MNDPRAPVFLQPRISVTRQMQARPQISTLPRTITSEIALSAPSASAGQHNWQTQQSYLVDRMKRPMRSYEEYTIRDRSFRPINFSARTIDTPGFQKNIPKFVKVRDTLLESQRVRRPDRKDSISEREVSMQPLYEGNNSYAVEVLLNQMQQFVQPI